MNMQRCRIDYARMIAIPSNRGCQPHFMCLECHRPYVLEMDVIVPCVNPELHIDKSRVSVVAWRAMLARSVTRKIQQREGTCDAANAVTKQSNSDTTGTSASAIKDSCARTRPSLGRACCQRAKHSTRRRLRS
jgi:hypothetical protein